MDVIVVATKNRSGTIVTAEKQNKKKDIQFSVRHVEIHENVATG